MCQQHQSKSPVAPLHPWSWPTRPWTRLHIDFAGPIKGQMVLIVIDAHSKWIEAIPTSSAVIEELRVLFSQFGIPETIVSDNGTCFTSVEFKQFLKKNGIVQILSAPYHPSTNGLAERAVQVAKSGLRKVIDGSLRSRIAIILFTYRLTAQSTTGILPNELLLGRCPRTRLDLLRPNTEKRVECQQAKQVQRHDERARGRTIKAGDKVFVQNYHQGELWLPGVVQDQAGPVSFRVRMNNGQLLRCHLDQVRTRTVDAPLVHPEETAIHGPMEVLPQLPEPTLPQIESMPQTGTHTPETVVVSPANVQAPEPTVVDAPTTEVHAYPKRNRKLVVRYDPSLM